MSANPTTSRPARVLAPNQGPNQSPNQSPIARIHIEWGLSRAGAETIAPQGTAPLLALRYEARPDQPERWTLTDPAANTSTTIPNPIAPDAIPTIRASGGCIHIQSPSMYAFISISTDEPELLYARTHIFRTLGIAGGRYQPGPVRVMST